MGFAGERHPHPPLHDSLSPRERVAEGQVRDACSPRRDSLIRRCAAPSPRGEGRKPGVGHTAPKATTPSSAAARHLLTEEKEVRFPLPAGEGGRRPGEGRLLTTPRLPHPPLRGTFSQREKAESQVWATPLPRRRHPHPPLRGTFSQREKACRFPLPPGEGGRRPGEGRLLPRRRHPHPPLRGTFSQGEKDESGRRRNEGLE